MKQRNNLAQPGASRRTGQSNKQSRTLARNNIIGTTLKTSQLGRFRWRGPSSCCPLLRERHEPARQRKLQDAVQTLQGNKAFDAGRLVLRRVRQHRHGKNQASHLDRQGNKRRQDEVGKGVRRCADRKVGRSWEPRQSNLRHVAHAEYHASGHASATTQATRYSDCCPTTTVDVSPRARTARR